MITPQGRWWLLFMVLCGGCPPSPPAAPEAATDPAAQRPAAVPHGAAATQPTTEPGPAAGQSAAPAPLPEAAADRGPYASCLRDQSAGALRAGLEIGGVKYHLQKGHLRPVEPALPRPLTLGVLGDTREALPATLALLGRAARLFKKRGAQAIIVLGGLDATYEGTRALLHELQGLPVLALPGDRASRAGFQAAVENLGPRYVDLSRVRGVLLPGLSLISVPGYALPHELLAKEQGCSYNVEELRALAQDAAALPAPRLLLSYGPPRGRGAEAVDRAFGGVNVGDPLLTRLITDAAVAFGLFAHVHEASGHATTASGHPVASGQWSPSLLLNVGAADSVALENLQGEWSAGRAALLEVDRARARYTLLQLEKPVDGAENRAN